MFGKLALTLIIAAAFTPAAFQMSRHVGWAANFQLGAVPEPGLLLLLGSALIAASRCARRELQRKSGVRRPE